MQRFVHSSNKRMTTTCVNIWKGNDSTPHRYQTQHHLLYLLFQQQRNQYILRHHLQPHHRVYLLLLAWCPRHPCLLHLLLYSALNQSYHRQNLIIIDHYHLKALYLSWMITTNNTVTITTINHLHHQLQWDNHTMTLPNQNHLVDPHLHPHHHQLAIHRIIIITK